MALLLVGEPSGGTPVQEAAAPWIEDVHTPHFFAVLVEDLDVSTRWYRTVFGLRELGGSEAEDGSWRILNLGNEDLFIELIQDDAVEGAERARGFFKVGFGVPDVERVADRVETDTGERPRVLAFPRFGVRIVQVRDPDGNLLQLFEPLPD